MSATGERPAGRPREAGTTLIEALAVMAITALVAGVGFPGVEHAIAAFSQRLTIDEVATRLHEAAAEARLRDAPVGFAVASDGAAYGLTGQAAAPVRPGVTLAVAPRAAATGGAGPVVFFGDGSSSGGEILVTAAGATTAIEVERTGVVRIRGA